MTYRMRLSTRLAVVTLWALVTFLPSPAQAHGVDQDAAELSWGGFVPLGIEHMLVGWDHLAFLAGVLLVAGSFRLAVKLVTVFVIGHSTTLILATAAGWWVNADIVDAVIALSVAFVGCVAALGRPRRLWWFSSAVAVFGLIHGLGLATRFAELGLPPEGRIAKVIFFNIGIEIGQATAIFAMTVAGLWIKSWLRLDQPAVPDAAPDEHELDEWEAPRSRGVIARQMSGSALLLVGMVTGSLILVDVLVGEGSSVPPVALPDGTTCAVRSLPGAMPAGGQHPDKAFYGPQESPHLADLSHAMGDGYVVVLYDPRLSANDTNRLRRYLSSHEDTMVAAPLDDHAASELPPGVVRAGSALTSLTQDSVMSCGALDVSSLRAFAEHWQDRI